MDKKNFKFLQSTFILLEFIKWKKNPKNKNKKKNTLGGEMSEKNEKNEKLKM